jgi:uncharacterized membrane-anchored protein
VRECQRRLFVQQPPYTITRPFGASWADWNDQVSGGLNLGQIPTAIYLGTIALGLVLYMSRRRIGYRPERIETAHTQRALATANALP